MSLNDIHTLCSDSTAKILSKININIETSLAVQWLGFCASSVGDMSSISGQGTEIPHVCVAKFFLKSFKKHKWSSKFKQEHSLQHYFK